MFTGAASTTSMRYSKSSHVWNKPSARAFLKKHTIVGGGSSAHEMNNNNNITSTTTTTRRTTPNPYKR